MPPKRKAAAKAASAVETDFLNLTELKAECTKRGLKVSGKKQDLIDRLEEFEASGGTKIKVEKPEEKDTKQTIKEKPLAEEEKKSKPKCQRDPDKYCTLSNAIVQDDYDCMLNQTNIGHNNNKFYVIQLLNQNGKYYTWNKWGRVGERGGYDLKEQFDFDAAKKDFEKKFKDKTSNEWKNRKNFKPVQGKYTLLEIDTSDETDAGEIEKKGDVPEEAMQKMNHDEKMPLGKLSKEQVAKGFEVLEEIEKALDSLEDLTSRFYTVIPHDFGRKRPPVINTMDVLRLQRDLLTDLGDIEIAQGMKREEESSQTGLQEVDHHLDVDYGLPDTTPELVDKKSKEFEV